MKIPVVYSAIAENTDNNLAGVVVLAGKSYPNSDRDIGPNAATRAQYSVLNIAEMHLSRYATARAILSAEALCHESFQRDTFGDDLSTSAMSIVYVVRSFEI